LCITRIFDAPITLVFDIWAKREHMIRWLGPTGFTCSHLDLDFREGGKWRACIESKTHGANWMGGAFRTIEKDRRIVMSFAWEDARRVDTLVTITFATKGGKTVQTFHQAPFTNVESRDSHVDGWNQCFDREQTYAEDLAKGEAA
jgi:uncharacterized protein YndB with AHSA1/START domain